MLWLGQPTHLTLRLCLSSKVLLKLWIKSTCHDLYALLLLGLWVMLTTLPHWLHCLALVLSHGLNSVHEYRSAEAQDARFLSVVCFSRCIISFCLYALIFVFLFPQTVLSFECFCWAGFGNVADLKEF